MVAIPADLFAYLGLVFGMLFMLAGVAAAVIGLVARRAWIAALSAIPVVIGLIIRAVGWWPQLGGGSIVLEGIISLAAAIIGILAGGPLLELVLRHIAREQGAPGAHGGILVADASPAGKNAAAASTKEVLRGGATIGYLERLAIIGSVALGHPEAIAVIVAIKGLGRFAELDTSPARERFIIGTLVSFIWAFACAALAVGW